MTSKKVVNVNSTEKSFQLIIGGLILFLSAVWQPIWAGEVDPMRTEIIDFELPEGWYLGEVAGLELLASGELVMFNRGAIHFLFLVKRGDLYGKLAWVFLRSRTGFQLMMKAIFGQLINRLIKSLNLIRLARYTLF